MGRPGWGRQRRSIGSGTGSELAGGGGSRSEEEKSCRAILGFGGEFVGPDQKTFGEMG